MNQLSAVPSFSSFLSKISCGTISNAFFKFLIMEGQGMNKFKEDLGVEPETE